MKFVHYKIKKKLINSFKNTIMTFVILTFIFHQGLAYYIGSFFDYPVLTKMGSAVLTKNSIEYNRFYISEQDLKLFKYIQEKVEYEIIFTEGTRLYQLYTYIGCNWNYSLLHKSNMQLLFNNENLKLTNKTYFWIPYTAVETGKLYYKTQIDAYYSINYILNTLFEMGFQYCYNYGSILLVYKE